MRTLIIIIFILISDTSFSQIAFEDITVWETNQSGINSSTIKEINQDGNGHLWFYHFPGMDEFDGSQWIYYSVNSDFYFLNPYYSCFTIASNNDFWAASPNSVIHFNDTMYEYFTNITSNPYYGKIIDILHASNGNVWIAYFNQGIYRYDGSTWTLYDNTNGLLSTYVWSIFEDSSGNIWTGCLGGISIFNGTSFNTIYANDIGGDEVHSITESNDGKIWVGTNHSIASFDGTNWVIYDMHNELAVDHHSIVSMAFDQDNKLWAAAEDNYVVSFDGLNWELFDESNYLPTKFITNIFCDQNNTIWFSTRDLGVFYHYGSNWESWSSVSGLLNNKVDAIETDSEGKVWFGTTNGLSSYDNGVWKSYHYRYDSIYWATSLELGIDNKLWLGGSYSGPNILDAAYIDNENIISYESIPSWSVLMGGIYDILADSINITWFATRLGGINRMEIIPNMDPQWTVYKSSDGLLSDTATALARHPNGDLYIGTWHGINIMHNDTLSVLSIAEAHQGISEHITDLLFDDQNRLWVASTQGLAYYDGQDWTTFDTGDSLADDYVNVIFEASDSSLWFGTNNGISRYKNSQFISWFKSDGLIADKVNDITEDLEHNLYFATDYGVSKLALNTLSVSKPYNNERNGLHVFPNPAIDKLHYELDGKEQGTLQLFDIKGMIRFENPNASPRGEINISMLPAGSYFLRFCDPDGTIHYTHFVVIR